MKPVVKDVKEGCTKIQSLCLYANFAARVSTEMKEVGLLRAGVRVVLLENIHLRKVLQVVMNVTIVHLANIQEKKVTLMKVNARIA